jgi:hypothetical protein
MSGAYKRRETLLTLVTSYEDCPIEIEKRKYLNITEGFMKFIANKVIEGDDIALPSKMGILRVYGKKSNPVIKDGVITGLSPDWKNTLALWKSNSEAKQEKKMLYHFNEHTRGIRYKFSWVTTVISLRFKSLYSFRASRNNKRTLWKHILGGQEYRLYIPGIKTIKQ